nr:unnamed protein product [Digitaria exilis]
MDSAAAEGTSLSSPPLLHWKRKAKDQECEILRLREELKLLQDGTRGEEIELPVASCRCHFFDGCRDLPLQLGRDGGEHWVDEVLRRRFLGLGIIWLRLDSSREASPSFATLSHLAVDFILALVP